LAPARPFPFFQLYKYVLCSANSSRSGAKGLMVVEYHGACEARLAPGVRALFLEVTAENFGFWFEGI
jgi:hypothetical protein